MTACTDDERRDVARRLREKKAECEERGYPWMCDDLVLALGYDHDYEAGDEIFDRLADLIDPDTTTDTTKSPDLTTKCDRDALLELADALEDGFGMTGSPSATQLQALADVNVELREHALIIREALGVVA